MNFKNLVFIAVFVPSFACAQYIDQKYFGRWINVTLKQKVKADKSGDSIYDVIPRYLYIKSSKEFAMQFRFEQATKKYKINRVKIPWLYYTGGKFQIKSDTILMNDKYLGNVKFIYRDFRH